MGTDYTPVRLISRILRIAGKPIDKAAAMRRVMAGQDVYTTKAYAKNLSRAIGGGRANKDGDYEIREKHVGPKRGVYFAHYHDPHRSDKTVSRGEGREPKRVRRKMGHIFYGEGYEIK